MSVSAVNTEADRDKSPVNHAVISTIENSSGSPAPPNPFSL